MKNTQTGQKNFLHRRSKWKISNSNAVCNINMKVNKYITHALCWKPLHPLGWQDLLITVDIYGPSQTTWRWKDGEIEPKCIMSVSVLKTPGFSVWEHKARLSGLIASALAMCLLLLMYGEVTRVWHVSVRPFKHLRELKPLVLLQSLKHMTDQHVLALRLCICFVILEALYQPSPV